MKSEVEHGAAGTRVAGMVRDTPDGEWRYPGLEKDGDGTVREIYKLQFEVVSSLGKGSQFYDNREKPTMPPEAVPDEFWTSVSTETTAPWQQYNTLREWVASNEHLVRNVRLFKMVNAPEWVPVEG